MSVEQDIMVNGHLDQQLLTEYAAHPEDVDDDIVEEIWRHLDDCDICTEDYDAIRDGQPPKEREPEEEEAVPEPVGSYALEPDVVHPDDLAETNVAKREDIGKHVNGLMPVGDDPDRNGKSPTSKGDNSSTIKTQSIIEAAIGKSEEDTADTEGEKRSSKKEPLIEGLISCEVKPLEKPIEQIETESAVEAGERLSQEGVEETNKPEEEAKEPESTDEAEAEGAADTEEVEGAEEAEEPDDDPFIDPAASSPRRHIDPSKLSEKVESSEKSTAHEEPTPPQPAGPPDEPEPIETEESASPPTSPKTNIRPKTVTSSQTAKSSQTAEPLEEFLNKAMTLLRRPRNAIIAGSIVVVVAAAIVIPSLMKENKQPSPVAGWAPLNVIETNVPLQELLIRKMRRGKIPPANGVDVTLNFRGIRKLVIAVDLDFVGKKASSHEVIVRNQEGDSVYREAIPQVYLDDGRAFLRLIPKLFEEGQTYTLEVLAHYDNGTLRILAQSAFDVLK
jgi:hypothetical protein